MKTIALTKGYSALVDDGDYEWLNQWSWSVTKGNRGKEYYAARGTRKNGKMVHIKMHRLILGITDPSVESEHKDGNGLNNQRHNLRTATHTQNRLNQKPSIANTSGVVGVYWYVSKKKWQVFITVNHKRVHLGYFSDIKIATEVRRAAELKYYGDYAPAQGVGL